MIIIIILFSPHEAEYKGYHLPRIKKLNSKLNARVITFQNLKKKKKTFKKIFKSLDKLISLLWKALLLCNYLISLLTFIAYGNNLGGLEDERTSQLKGRENIYLW